MKWAAVTAMPITMGAIVWMCLLASARWESVAAMTTSTSSAVQPNSTPSASRELALRWISFAPPSTWVGWAQRGRTRRATARRERQRLPHLVEQRGCHDANEAGARNCANALCDCVADRTSRADRLCERQCKRHGRINVRPRDAGEDKDENGNCVSKDERNPAERHVGCDRQPGRRLTGYQHSLHLPGSRNTTILREDDAADRGEDWE